MINAWSLLYDEIYGEDKMTENIEINTGTGQTVFNVPDDIEHSDAWYDYKRNDPDRENPFTDPKDRARAERVVTGSDEGVVNIPSGVESDDVLTIDGGDTINFDDGPLSFSTLADNDDSIAHHIELPDDFVNFDLGVGNTAYADTVHLDLGSYSDPFVSGADVVVPPTPGIQKDCTRKYKEDESIKALQDYISTTYGGHYTSDNNNVQTLDLIESVGDAESFCRSNAIKYLSRYDKKGQAKRDILKALHYSLLLYHFSGQLNETPTRGYETF